VKPRSHKQEAQVIVYDADRIQQPGPELFDAAHWEARSAVAGQAVGRGRTLLLDTEYGPAVLRQYLRGGWPARLSRDLYLFTGYQRSRPLAEFHMLAELSDLGLPVPVPLAALCARQGLWYRGCLMMERILQVTPLADLIAEHLDDDSLWRRCGAVIRRFHAAGVVHADLNARNILVGQGPAIHLVDFDRARLAATDAAAFRANLARLRRSLEKLWPEPRRERLEGCWKQLLGGYAQAGEAV
jgi:3-deoxy-D-manno-octulosonic acid kinase